MRRPRYLRPVVDQVLAAGKKAFIGGPRQVGKTTLALELLGKGADERHPAYLNWDDPRMRARMRNAELPADEALVVFDEIHKYARWRNLLKGIWDTERSFRRIVGDWSTVPTERARFENLVASQLLKYCHLLEDTEGWRMDLRFVRDTDRREVDFVVLRGRQPLFAVECKTGDRAIGSAVSYFADRTAIPRFYQVHRGQRHFATGKITVLPFERFCIDLELP